MGHHVLQQGVLTTLVFFFLTNSAPAVGGGVKILFESELGAADFHLPNRSCIVYVSECDIIAGNAFKRKLVRHRNVSRVEETIVSLSSVSVR